LLPAPDAAATADEDTADDGDQTVVPLAIEQDRELLALEGPTADRAGSENALVVIGQPDGLGLEDARAELMRLRDAIAPEIPDAERAKGLLRRAMITELLKKRPLDEDEFHRYVRQSLRQDTAPGQLSKYGPRIFEILKRLSD